MLIIVPGMYIIRNMDIRGQLTPEKLYSGRKTTLISAAAAVIGAAGLLILTYMIAVSGGTSWDDPVREWFYSMRSPGLTTLMELITRMGEWYTATLILLLLVIYPKTRNGIGIPASCAVILSQLIKSVLKTALTRPRPDEILHLIKQGGWSFPSGHSITSMTMYMMLFILLLIAVSHAKKEQGLPAGPKMIALLVLLLFLSFAVGLSRIYLGVHYPSDVLAGWCGGVFSAGLVFFVLSLRCRKDRAGIQTT